ncbi:MAG TPA: aldehyde ferredoxin oxidoreductase C-terminal domain-containing protein [Methylomirabilota bacterium]|nr:aldehyde ferredoxin oxidoreductase C-terminal domain-containing protein [Methylomirabilota bacterium]
MSAPKKTAKPQPTLPGGFAGRILRVDMTKRKTWSEPWTPDDMRDQLGGIGLGSRVLYHETARGKGNVGWDHPDNRLVLATGPLAGLPVWGTGGLTVITIGAQTNGPTSTQANGFFGTNLKYCGYDAIVIQGQSKDWVYLYINDDVVELRDATPYLGKDTWETQDALSRDHGLSGHQLSVYSIGPAGEKLVRFAAIQGDYGHVASKNGVGAVMGKKKLKAVAIVKGTRALRAADPRGLVQCADDIAHDLKTDPSARSLYEYGTLPGVSNLYKLGALPIRNYTTSVTDVDMSTWEAPKLRHGFDHRGHQCNACGMHHCHMSVIRQGPHKGAVVDEPEYEGWSGAGWTIGATEMQGVAWLNTQIDRACVDVNEFGWLCGWVMEGVEQGWITRQQLGFDLKWGDTEGANRLLQMINKREGFGDLLAEGVKRAAEKLGGSALEAAVFTAKGASPRGHDHRARWEEMLDTCTSSTATMETGNPVHQTEVGLPARINPFDGEQVALIVAGCRGRRNFEDSLGICIFTTRTRLENVCRALSAATGWTYTVEEAMRQGRRTAAINRAVALRCGLTPDLEKPSPRYGSTPHNGPAKGQSVSAQWEKMVDTWYGLVGYDRKTGKPRPETLKALGLDWLAKELWGRR